MRNRNHRNHHKTQKKEERRSKKDIYCIVVNRSVSINESKYESCHSGGGCGRPELRTSFANGATLFGATVVAAGAGAGAVAIVAADGAASGCRKSRWSLA